MVKDFLFTNWLYRMKTERVVFQIFFVYNKNNLEAKMKFIKEIRGKK